MAAHGAVCVPGIIDAPTARARMSLLNFRSLVALADAVGIPRYTARTLSIRNYVAPVTHVRYAVVVGPTTGTAL